jgi:hypothetical protein
MEKNRAHVYTSIYSGRSDRMTHEYDLVTNRSEDSELSKVELKRSASDSWMRPSETVITCKKDLEDAEYKFKVNGKKLKLNAAELFELFVVLSSMKDEVLEGRSVELRSHKLINTIK